MFGQTPRFNSCVQADAAPDFDGVGYVNLIDADWEMPDPATYAYEASGLGANKDPMDESIRVRACDVGV